MKVSIDIVAESAFEILFNDKEFLFNFQGLVKKVIAEHLKEYPEEYFQKEFVVKRVNYIPTWLRSAIFFRDRGRCQQCMKDVSGQIYLDNKYHLNHMLPQAAGGTNDPTNFQLLCDECNLGKSDNIMMPKNREIKYLMQN
jgi:5-methylcytosine-specific restriction endonuclease McrA